MKTISDLTPYQSDAQAWANFKDWVAMGYDNNDRNNSHWTLTPHLSYWRDKSEEGDPVIHCEMQKFSAQNGRFNKWIAEIPNDGSIETFQELAIAFIEAVEAQ